MTKEEREKKSAMVVREYIMTSLGRGEVFVALIWCFLVEALLPDGAGEDRDRGKEGRVRAREGSLYPISLNLDPWAAGSGIGNVRFNERHRWSCGSQHRQRDRKLFIDHSLHLIR